MKQKSIFLPPVRVSRPGGVRKSSQKSSLKTIFLDGKMIRAKDELIDSLAPGIVRGEGAFETMRSFNGKIFALDKHLKRLFRGLRLLKIRSPYTRKLWERHLYRMIEINFLKDARIRLAVWNEGKKQRRAIVCQDIQNFKYKQKFKAIISGIRRKKTRFSSIKSMDYYCFREAYKEAKHKGYDEAILLNSHLELVEGSRTNIFFVKKGALCTPCIKTGCLNGITRQLIVRHARNLKIPCRAVHAGVRDLLRAEEAFVTNSLIGIIPLTNVNGRSIDHGKTGPLTKKLMNAYKIDIHSCSV